MTVVAENKGTFQMSDSISSVNSEIETVCEFDGGPSEMDLFLVAMMHFVFCRGARPDFLEYVLAALRRRGLEPCVHQMAVLRLLPQWHSCVGCDPESRIATVLSLLGI